MTDYTVDLYIRAPGFHAALKPAEYIFIHHSLAAFLVDACGNARPPSHDVIKQGNVHGATDDKTSSVICFVESSSNNF